MSSSQILLLHISHHPKQTPLQASPHWCLSAAQRLQRGSVQTAGVASHLSNHCIHSCLLIGDEIREESLQPRLYLVDHHQALRGRRDMDLPSPAGDGQDKISNASSYSCTPSQGVEQLERIMI
ncbi:hypothetical protein VZT92_009269 [Zoarces viviparus]|uniref:Uncharacterized protein n=1 Tax=Zoarces viviparus TaxID=48416 RepID=A0AAW1FJ70_ZOAVI